MNEAIKYIIFIGLFIGIVITGIAIMSIRANKDKYFYNEVRNKTIVGAVAIALMFIVVIILLVIPVKKSDSNTEEFNGAEVTSSKAAIEIEVEQTESESETEVVETNIGEVLKNEISLLRHGNRETLTRWFGSSTGFSDMARHIKEVQITNEVGFNSEEGNSGEVTISVYNDRLEEEILEQIRLDLRSKDSLMSDIEIESIVNSTFSQMDKTDLTTAYIVEVKLVDGEVVVTEELKNIITGGDYMGIVLNSLSGDSNIGSDIVEESSMDSTSVNSEVMQRGVGN